jgi:hypothetical protein
VQLLILYQLATAKAAIALGGESARTPDKPAPVNSQEAHEQEQQAKEQHARGEESTDDAANAEEQKDSEGAKASA